jgi:putative membrane protein insertion efficiency factor
MRHAIIMLINIYQRFLSPIMGHGCRFHPTCSCYAHQAIERYGVIKGGALALWRLARCQPWATGGVDPVPEPVHQDK